MAVKTRITPDEAAQLLKSYDIGMPIRLEGIAGGTVQTNYYLTTTCGEYVLRLYENRGTEDVRYEGALLKALRAADFPCPDYVPASDGEIHFLHGKPCAVFSRLMGSHCETPSPRQREALIRTTARMALITPGIRLPACPQRFTYVPEWCREYAARLAEEIGTGNAREKGEWYAREAEELVLPPELPMGVCHTDFYYENILYSGEELTGLIDFDDANRTYLLFDAVCLTDFFIPAFSWNTWQSFAPDADMLTFREARNVLRIYEQVRPLCEAEKQHFFDVVKLSILIDCLWYFRRGDAADFYEKRKLDHLNRLGREEFTHRLFSD